MKWNDQVLHYINYVSQRHECSRRWPKLQIPNLVFNIYLITEEVINRWKFLIFFLNKFKRHKSVRNHWTWTKFELNLFFLVNNLYIKLSAVYILLLKCIVGAGWHFRGLFFFFPVKVDIFSFSATQASVYSCCIWQFFLSIKLNWFIDK